MARRRAVEEHRVSGRVRWPSGGRSGSARAASSGDTRGSGHRRHGRRRNSSIRKPREGSDGPLRLDRRRLHRPHTPAQPGRPSRIEFALVHDIDPTRAADIAGRPGAQVAADLDAIFASRGDESSPGPKTCRAPFDSHPCAVLQNIIVSVFRQCGSAAPDGSR
jgi:hypothetical protein